MSKFNQIFSILQNEGKTIEFNELWNNGTGYGNGAASGSAAPKLAVGEAVCSVDSYGRRLVIMGLSKKSNIVIFDSYTDQSMQTYNSGNSKVYTDNGGAWTSGNGNTLEQVLEYVANKLEFSELPSVVVDAVTPRVTEKEIIMETNEMQHPQVPETPVFNSVVPDAVEVKIMDIDSKTEPSSETAEAKKVKFGDNLTYIRDRKSGIMGMFDSICDQATVLKSAAVSVIKR